MQIKTEYLSKLYNTNMQGETLHDRQLKNPFPALVKKLSKNHFESRKGSVSEASNS